MTTSRSCPRLLQPLGRRLGVTREGERFWAACWAIGSFPSTCLGGAVQSCAPAEDLNSYSANASNAAFSNRQTETRKTVEQAQRVLMLAVPEWCYPNARKGYHPYRAMEIREPLDLCEAIPAGRRCGLLRRIRQSREIVDESKGTRSKDCDRKGNSGRQADT